MTQSAVGSQADGAVEQGLPSDTLVLSGEPAAQIGLVPLAVNAQSMRDTDRQLKSNKRQAKFCRT